MIQLHRNCHCDKSAPKVQIRCLCISVKFTVCVKVKQLAVFLSLFTNSYLHRHQKIQKYDFSTYKAQNGGPASDRKQK